MLSRFKGTDHFVTMESVKMYKDCSGPSREQFPDSVLTDASYLCRQPYILGF